MDPQNTPFTNDSQPSLTPVDPVSVAEPVAPQTDDRQQVINKLQTSTNVLVTVGSKPTVDELSSALGLTLLLDKLDKHATTVFSGEIPRAIEFLDPEATFENNVDSLRDFIIALDKEKADKLRYKVEEDVVRIFITPYKTKISEKDLQFSQGDFNVDVIVALGVVNREDLDKAITAHGRILHDATVITVNTGQKSSNLGSINWSETDVSSIAEMLVGVGDSLGSNLLDSQISTAFLTGVVASTNRFSNEKTSPKVMTLAAQLMAAGANQQLIASNLRQDGVLTESVRDPSKDHTTESEVVVDHEKNDQPSKSKKPKTSKAEDKGSKESDIKTEDEAEAPESSEKTDSFSAPDFPPKVKDDNKPSDVAEPASESTMELPDDLKQQLEPALEAKADDEIQAKVSDVKLDSAEAEEAPKPEESIQAEETSNDEPAFNATMAQVETEKKEDASLSDGGSIKPSELPSLPTAPSLSLAPDSSQNLPSLPPASEEQISDQTSMPAGDQSLDASESLDQSKEDALEEARKAVESAAESQPFNPANQPLESINAQPLPEIHPEDSSVIPASTPLPSVELPTQPAGEGTRVNGSLESLPEADSEFLSGEKSEEPDTSPMDSFMSAHQKPVLQPESDASSDPSSVGVQPPAPDVTGALPPLPPTLPSAPADNSLPPLPPLPGQDMSSPTMTPDVNPGFMQDLPTSQNPLTQAADDLAVKKQQEEQARQDKMNEMTQQYDSAVDRNRELQGLPPVNDPNGSGLPPLPPAT
jgi:hypothetical protein